MAGLKSTFVKVDINASGNPTTPIAGGAAATVSKLIALANGTGTGQVNRAYIANRTLSAAGTEDLDVNGTALVDVNGDAVALDNVKLIWVENTSPNGTGSINLMNAAANGVGNGATGFVTAAGDKWNIPAGGCGLWYSPTGFAVTAATADLITVAAPGTAATYTIVILGVDS